MLPSILLLGIGSRRHIWIPLPIFLLWPFWLLGWPIWFLLWFLRISWRKPVRVALMLALGLSGLLIDVDTKDGDHIYIRMI